MTRDAECPGLAPDPDEPAIEREVRLGFHHLFYRNRCWWTWWCGVPVCNNPLDLWVYQQIIWDCRPNVVIETGTGWGGSALFLAMLLDRRGEGRVFTVDLEPQPNLPQHPRLTYVVGSSTNPCVVEQVASYAQGRRTMVILDSDHTFEHVRRELECYASLVTPGQYLVVSDTNLNGNPVGVHWGPGPNEAVQEFLALHPEFRANPECEFLGLTFNPGGFLARLPEGAY